MSKRKPKLEPLPDWWILELVLLKQASVGSLGGLSLVEHVQPLCERGLIRQATPETNSFELTEHGLLMWFGLTSIHRGASDADIPKLIEDSASDWAKPRLEGKGIDSTFTYGGEHLWVDIAKRAILAGYFEFISYRCYPPQNSMDRSMRVRLTREGFEYFGSLPRLRLECA